MSEVMEQGIIAYADDFTVSSEGGKADSAWDETTGALAEDRFGNRSVHSRALSTKAEWDGQCVGRDDFGALQG